MKYDLENPSTDKCQTPKLVEIYEHFFTEPVGRFVEVGAYNGISWSNTYCLAKLGWSGLLIEPIPSFVDEIKENYANFKDVKIHCGCASNYTGQAKIHIGGPLSSITKGAVDTYNKISWFKGVLRDNFFINAPVNTLDNILTQYGVGPFFDLLVIDVEGEELNVLKGFDIYSYRPKMVIIEMHEDCEYDELQVNNAEIHQYMRGADYSKIYSDTINTVFVESKIHKDFKEKRKTFKLK